MSKVTSKLQVTVPKAIAEAHGIRPGDQIEWTSTGETIRVQPRKAQRATGDNKKTRLQIFDRGTERQGQRQRGGRPSAATDRGWTRDDLNDRGRPR